MTTPTTWRGSTAIRTLGPSFYEEVDAARFPAATLRWRNDRAAARVGLEGLSDAEWVAHFARFQPLPDSLERPLALAYHGHQFRHYNPNIGDGRGFLFAQGIGSDGRLLDLGTKGSGTTPFSRSGDGRLTLKGAVREILATERLAALGVPTSDTLSVVETGEALVRGDEPSPTRSAVLVRLSHGHIRIGSFQRLVTLGDTAGLEALTDYVLRRLYGVEPDERPALKLLRLVVERTAWLAASYMVASFVHGVLNSDNINVTGESFDYGPWRFAPTWDAGFIAAYFDDAGLYAFGRQAEAILWDVAQLARALLPLADLDSFTEALDRFAPTYRAALGEQAAWRLGVKVPDPTDFSERLERGLSESGVPLDQFWRDWRGGAPDGFDPALQPLADALPRYRAAQLPTSTPLLIDEVERIWAAVDAEDDWSLLHAAVADARALGAALSESPAVARSRSGSG